MRYLHTMLRVRDLDAALDFYCNKLGLKEVRRIVSDQGKFTLVFLAAGGDDGLVAKGPENRAAPLVELTYNWDSKEDYGEARPTNNPSNCCRRAQRCHPRSHGPRCPIPGIGEPARAWFQAPLMFD
jgi:catechol 2,3-dioxygenase-like lactoylglutathione lyase family enzyme